MDGSGDMQRFDLFEIHALSPNIIMAMKSWKLLRFDHKCLLCKESSDNFFFFKRLI